MITKKYGGVTLTYDDTIKVGDLITAYHSGYHKLLRIEPRKANPPLFYYKTVFRDDGTPVNSKAPKSCDASYCRFAAPEIKQKIAMLNNILYGLQTL
jgi:hypothetical protein